LTAKKEDGGKPWTFLVYISKVSHLTGGCLSLSLERRPFVLPVFMAERIHPQFV
jgi:hypothetical protein